MVNAEKHRRKKQQQVQNMFKQVKYLDTMKTKVKKRKSNVLDANMNVGKHLLSRKYKDGL